ncbi:MAG TPA: hypothetical protein V6C84_12315 [Coleofasciculaceae cyanobacterium]|jgi:hypothetical protein
MVISQHQTYLYSVIEELGEVVVLRSLEEVTAEILQLEQGTEGLLKRLISFGDSN